APDATFGSLGSVTFAGGSGNLVTQTVNFMPAADSLVEGNEDATLTPSGPTLNNQVTYTAGTVTIQDANTATVRVVGQTVNENGSPPQAITVQIGRASGREREELLVVVDAAAAEGREAADARLGSLGSVTFAGGSGNLAIQTVEYAPIPDIFVKGNEAATLTPSGPTLNNQVTYTAGTVTIQDGNTATVRVVGQTVNENGSPPQAITV